MLQRNDGFVGWPAGFLRQISGGRNLVHAHADNRGERAA